MQTHPHTHKHVHNNTTESIINAQMCDGSNLSYKT